MQTESANCFFRAWALLAYRFPVFVVSRQDYEEDTGGEVQGTAFAEDGVGATRLRIYLRTIEHVSIPDCLTTEASRFTSEICRGRHLGKI